jgi:hypothetical protein
MQLLYVQEKDGFDEQGKLKKKEKKIFVVRSWSDSSGAAIYLHGNGIYGYKDGSPIRKPEEFNIIGNDLQRDQALGWWERKGKKFSEEYWSKKKEAERTALLSSSPDAVNVGMNTLDAALYARRPAAKRANSLFSEPMHWWEFGWTLRPPWWGYLVKAEDANWYYRLANPETVGLKAESVKPEAESGGDSTE